MDCTVRQGEKLVLDIMRAVVGARLGRNGRDRDSLHRRAVIVEDRDWHLAHVVLARSAIGIAGADPHRRELAAADPHIESFLGFRHVIVEDRQGDLLACLPHVVRLGEIGRAESDRLEQLRIVVFWLCRCRIRVRKHAQGERRVGPGHTGGGARHHRDGCRCVALDELVGGLLRSNRNRRICHDHADRRRARRTNRIAVSRIDRHRQIAGPGWAVIDRKKGPENFNGRTRLARSNGEVVPEKTRIQKRVFLRDRHGTAQLRFRISLARYLEDDIVDPECVRVLLRLDGQRGFLALEHEYRHHADIVRAGRAVGIARADSLRRGRPALEHHVQALVDFHHRKGDRLARLPFSALGDEVAGFEVDGPRIGPGHVARRRLVRSRFRGNRDGERLARPGQIWRGAGHEGDAHGPVAPVDRVGSLLRADRDRRVLHLHARMRGVGAPHDVVGTIDQGRSQNARLRRRVVEQLCADAQFRLRRVRRKLHNPIELALRQVEFGLSERRSHRERRILRARAGESEDDIVDAEAVGVALGGDGHLRLFFEYLGREVPRAGKQERCSGQSQDGSSRQRAEDIARRAAAWASRVLHGRPKGRRAGMGIGHDCIPSKTKTPRAGIRARRCIRVGGRQRRLAGPEEPGRRAGNLGGRREPQRTAAGGPFGPQAADDPSDNGGRRHAPIPVRFASVRHPKRTR